MCAQVIDVDNILFYANNGALVVIRPRAYAYCLRSQRELEPKVCTRRKIKVDYTANVLPNV